MPPSSRRRYSIAAAYLLTVASSDSSNMSAVAAFRAGARFGIARRAAVSSTVNSAFVSSGRRQKSSHVSVNERTTRFAPNSATFRPSSALLSSVAKDTPSSSSSDYDVTNAEEGLAGTSYEPSKFESSVYNWWETSGCFDPDAKQSAETSKAAGKEPYVLPMPPPNVTGRLHMGHAIFVALQDVLARFHRMRGRPVLWTPGTDHAGIATQLQVEKILMAEGKRRGTEEEIAAAQGNDEELAKLVGRDEFLEKVWEYKEEQGGAITSQLRALGASADWSRERFTMDPALSVGVSEAFCRLHEKGLVYRGTYMVNWSPGLMTAVSDLEVEYTDEEGKLYYFKYMVESEDEEGKPSEEFLAVATTRPETIFGDTAVCVNPEDERYSHLIGKRVLVPMSHTNNESGKMRSIPIITDDYVDMEFGTGALKITPGHDPNDYELGKKYDLEIMNVMNKDATMNSACGDRYEGLDRFEARTKLWEDMEGEGLVIKAEPHMQRVPRSQRGGEIIEPLVSKQWFVKTEGMGAKALAAVKDGDITIVPQRFEKVWYGWLTDIRDWCISRQLWWGHRIPVWYVGDSDEEFIVARNDEEALQKAIEAGHPADVTLRQEDDVLDTWFSSGLWPFATVGWPQDENGDESSDLARFYPGTCLETGYDIIFFWVARMVMLGIELTGVSPFQVIYLHGLVRAADGSKMSKTKGNVVDPLDTVGEFGADSLRYSLVTGVTPGQDIPLNMDKIAANKAFANKLWNCCKFVTDNALKDADEAEIEELGVRGPIGKEEFEKLALPERYIISKCHELVASVTEDIEKYQLGAAGSKIYEFLWDQYAAWYIEISKTRLYEGFGGGGDDARTARRVLVYILDTSMRLLHPYMPYVTEQLWHHLPRAPKADGMVANSLMLADWPQMDDEAPLVMDADAVATFECFQALIGSIRNARAEYNVEQGKKISATVVAPGHLKDAIEAELKSLVMLAKLDPDNVAVLESGSEEAKAAAAGDSAQLVVQDGVEAYLPRSGLIDVEKEKARLEKQSTKLAKEIEKLAGRLNSKGFVDKAPEAVVEKARGELAELEDQASKVRASLEAL